MPKQPSLPRYRLHKARSCGVVTIRGRNYYLGKLNSPESLEKYARLIAEHFGNGRPVTSSPIPAPAVITVSELILRYWREHVEAYYVKDGKPTERQYHIRLALAPLRKLYGATPAADFGPRKLKAVRNEIIEEGLRARGGLNRGYINDHVGIIKKMFRWGVGEEILPRDVGPAICQQLDAVENLHKNKDARVQESRKILPADKSDVRRARRHMAPQIRTMVNLQLLSGMRPDEVTIMRSADIEKVDGIWLYWPSSHKMDHKDITKVVPLGPRAQKLLTPWLNREPEAHLFSPREVVQELRQPQQNGKQGRSSKRRQSKKSAGARQPREHYDDESYCRAVKRACRKADVPEWTPGQLRHNAATRISRMFGRETARQLLGHGSTSTTNIYIEEKIAEAVNAMKKVG